MVGHLWKQKKFDVKWPKKLLTYRHFWLEYIVFVWLEVGLENEVSPKDQNPRVFWALHTPFFQKDNPKQMAKNLETNNELTEGGDGDDCVLAGVQLLQQEKTRQKIYIWIRKLLFHCVIW